MKRLYVLLMSIVYLQINLYALSIDATGVGKSEKEAKQEALNALSGQIITTVNTTQERVKTAQKGSFSSSVKNRSSHSSKTLLKGVEYAVFDTDKGYKATATLSSEAIKESIDYLYVQLSKKEIGNAKGLSDQKLDDLLQKATLLKALLYYPRISSVLGVDIDQMKSNLQRREKLLHHRRGDYGSIVIDTGDKKAIVKIENKTFKNGEEIFLTPNKYSIRVSKKGYKSTQITKRIVAKKYDYKQVDLVPIKSETTFVYVDYGDWRITGGKKKVCEVTEKI